MGHIKEPYGVDLVIKSRPLTKDEEIAISEYIRIYKAKHRHSVSRKSGKPIPTKRNGKLLQPKQKTTTRKKIIV